MTKDALFHFQAVIYREEGSWMAHCLELDIVGDGETRDAAIAAMKEAVAVHLQSAIEDDDLQHLYSAAPKEYWELFKKAFPLDPIEIDMTERIDNAVAVRASKESGTSSCVPSGTLRHERPDIEFREAAAT